MPKCLLTDPPKTSTLCESRTETGALLLRLRTSSKFNDLLFWQEDSIVNSCFRLCFCFLFSVSDCCGTVNNSICFHKVGACFNINVRRRLCFCIIFSGLLISLEQDNAGDQADQEDHNGNAADSYGLPWLIFLALLPAVDE